MLTKTTVEDSKNGTLFQFLETGDKFLYDSKLWMKFGFASDGVAYTAISLYRGEARTIFNNEWVIPVDITINYQCAFMK